MLATDAKDDGDSPDADDGRYFTRLAAAFVRGRMGRFSDELTETELVRAGLSQGLRLHKFKRNAELPRVRRVLGILQGLGPASLLDIGSGRGTFLWPLLDAFPHLKVTAIDVNPVRVADINAVSSGGISSLQALQMDAGRITLADDYAEVVTALEVLEHLPSPASAAREAVRVARNFVVASVPSKADENPEHIQLFDKQSFESLWLAAGAASVKIDFVLNHMIAVARVAQRP